jgi:hypothetical protein
MSALGQKRTLAAMHFKVPLSFILLGEGVRPTADRVGHRRHFTFIYVKAKDVRPRIMAGYVKIELATRNFPAVNVGSENCRTLKIWTCEHSAER